MSHVLQGELILSSSRPSSPTLESLLPRFFAADTTIQHPHTIARYRRSVKYLSDMLGRSATLDDLNEETVGLLVRWLQLDRKQEVRTANGTITSIIKIWRWARDRNFIQTGPTIKPLRVPKRIPTSYGADHIAKLVEAARRQTGCIGGLPAPLWWLTVLQLLLNCGCRTTELLALRWEWVDWSSGWLRVPARVRKGKSGDQVYALWSDTIEWLKRFRKDEGLILGWDECEKSYYHYWNQLLETAGLPRDRYHKGQALRRTFATVVHFAGGDASAALGHSDPSLAFRHYIDPTKGQQARHADVIPAEFRPLSVASAKGGESNE